MKGKKIAQVPFIRLPKSMIGDTWERSNDIHGHRALMDIKCGFCGDDMVLRHSRILTKGHYPLWGPGKSVNMISMKCAGCACVEKFHVPDDIEYLKEIREKFRGGMQLFIPTKEEWTAEDIRIAEQLEALGYYGGR